MLAYLHAGTPLARATPPALPRPRGRRCVEDERLVASILGDRPRGFLLELASKGGPGPAPGDTEYVSPAWLFIPGILMGSPGTGTRGGSG